MFDLVTITTPPLTDDKIDSIVWRNGLQTHSRNGLVFYDNLDTKNLKQQHGIYIQIETNRRLKLEGSLHKYYNEVTHGERSNADFFTMSEAKWTIERLLFDKGIEMEDARIYGYEIGLNLILSKDCQLYLNKIVSVVDRFLYVDPLYVNPRHKNERMKISGFKRVRKYFKVYDKVHECIDKKRKIIPNGNILRIETVHKRLDNFRVIDFFSVGNLRKILEAFFRDWRTIRFERDIITPKGTGRAKRQICIDIMEKGKDAVLMRAKERHQNGSLSDWEYRNMREFTNKEWDDIKKSILFIQSDEELEFRELVKINYEILKRDEIIN